MDVNQTTHDTDRWVVNADDMQKSGINRALNARKDAQEKNEQNDLVIDWFECTFMHIGLTELFDHFGLKADRDMVYIPQGMNFYDSTYVYKQKIKFMFCGDVVHGKSNMGIHMMLSGFACREFEREFNWEKLFDLCVTLEANISRVDIAWDIFHDKYFTINTIRRSLVRGLVVCKAKTALNVQQRLVSTGDLLGHSVKFGSSSSGCSLIFYDKLEERKSTDDYIVDDSIKHWYRVEIRLRKDSAKAFVSRVVSDWNNFGSIASAVLNNYICFKSEGTVKQKTRWDDSPWWTNFINTSEKLPLAAKAIQSTIQQKIDWMDKSVSKTYSAIFMSQIDDLDELELDDFIKQGYRKLSIMDLVAINAYRIEHGASIISKEAFLQIKKKLMPEIMNSREFSEW